MIPTIGIIIGTYVFTRMVSFLTRNGDRKESILVKILAAITAIITFIGVMDLIATGTP